MFFVFQFHISFAKLWIWEYAVFALFCRLKCPLNLSSDQRKVSLNFLEKIKCESFWFKDFGLLAFKSVHDRPNSPS